MASRLNTTSNVSITKRRTSAANTVPVYFHVINTGANPAQGNVTDAMLDSQIDALNNTYGGSRGGSNTPFRFVKVGTDRTTNATWSGMDIYTPEEEAAKKALHVGGADVLNFYVANPPNGTLGWATWPSDYVSQPWRDGVVIKFTTLPGGAEAGFNMGFTATHEVGHWLGLFHTFDGGCSTTNDGVSDTPAQLADTSGCPSPNPDTCTGAAFPGVDPIHNYMDYSDDACMTEFTAGQNTRMDANFTRYRDQSPDDVVLVGGTGWNSIPVAKADGDGRFTVTSSASADFASWAALSSATKLSGDFNNDGQADIALVGGPANWTTVPLALSKGDGGFTITNRSVTDFPSWSRASGAKRLTGDFNRDGRDDLLLTGPSGWTTLPVAFSNGDGTFNVTNRGVGDFGMWSSLPGVTQHVADFNRDGRDDVALVGGSGWTTVPVAFSNGDGTFSVKNGGVGDFNSWARASNARRLVGDFNGDGRADIAITGPSGWSTLPVALSNGDGTFTVRNYAISNFASYAATSGAVPLVGDFDRDGTSDVALTGPAGWGSLPIAFSNSDGSFRVTNTALANFPGWAAVTGASKLVGDFNRDGYADIMLLGGSGWSTIPVALSNGLGGFTVVNGANANFASWALSGNLATKLQGNYRPQ